MSATTFELRLRFESDWQVGEGAGRVGSIDRIARRDPATGLPYVPAKTLTGIVRDAAERAARALDDGQASGPWQEFCARLFGRQSKGAVAVGSTTSAALRLGAAGFEPALAAALQAHSARELRAALAFVKPGVAIDAESGQARDRMLRMEEVVVAGAELSAPVELDAALPPPVSAAAYALLAAACRLVSGLGAKRRRGLGRCVLTLRSSAGAAPDWAVLDADPPVWDDAARKSHARLVEEAAAAAPAAGWRGLLLRLELLGPLVVPDATLGNVVTTRDHVPGSLLLPALDAQLRAALGNHAAELTSWLAQGRLRVGHAYLWQGGVRLLPAPQALAADKDDPARVVNEFEHASDDAAQRKALRGGYLSPQGLPAEEGSPVVQRVATLAATHATIDDEPQRPTAAVGGVYSYEAIAPGQTLAAEVRWDAALPLDAATLAKRLHGQTLRIGRAKKDDYGRVRLHVEPRDPPAPLPAPGERHTLWLASPLLARDARLRPLADGAALVDWINRQLGTNLKLEQARLRLLRDEGWSSAWREPRPTRFALAPGGCLLLRGAIDAAACARLAAGLGERRGEGYGELLLDAPLLQGAIPRQRPPTHGPSAAAPAAVTQLRASDFTRALHARAWRRAVRQHALTQAAAVARELGWTDGRPPSSQLGALIAQLQFWDPQRFAAWWQQLKARDNRRDKWPQASIAALDAWARDPLGHLFGDAGRLQGLALPLLPGHDRAALQTALAPQLTRVYWLTVVGAELDRRALAERAAQVEAPRAARGG
jgi:CRISPR-associated protein Csx10